MKISYDAEVDALYIRLLEGRHECRCVRLSDEVALNIGAGEKLVGIEILDAREVLGSGKIPAVLLEGLESATAPLALHENPPENYSSPSETPPSTK
jgi:uncharacterized protein YuzE